MSDEQREKRIEALASNLGYGEARIIHIATILHEGWEMDNRGYIVEFSGGSRLGLTTSHGGIYEWTLDEAREKLEETEESAASIRKAMELFPAEKEQANGKWS